MRSKLMAGLLLILTLSSLTGCICVPYHERHWDHDRRWGQATPQPQTPRQA